MNLFPIKRPALGLSITTDTACLVEIQGGLRGRGFRRLAHQTLPDGLIQLSPTKPNISDSKLLSEVLRALTKNYKKPQPIVLSLPDVCGRTALFEFNTFPRKIPDREKLLSWRFQQDINLPTKNARIGFRLYETKKQTKGTQAQPPLPTRVIATAVPNTIIEQYELSCLQAGLLPLGVGLSSLDVFDFLASTIKESAQMASRRSPRPGNDLLFLYLAGWGFSFIALRAGCPTFVRVKSLRLLRPKGPQLQSVEAPGAQDPLTAPGSSQAGDSVTSPSQGVSEAPNTSSSSEITKILSNELVATLQYYFESFQLPLSEGQNIPLYIAEGNEPESTRIPDTEEIETMLKSSMIDFPRISLISFSDHLGKSLPKGHTLTPQSYPKALPAYASAMVST